MTLRAALTLAVVAKNDPAITSLISMVSVPVFTSCSMAKAWTKLAVPVTTTFSARSTMEVMMPPATAKIAAAVSLRL